MKKGISLITLIITIVVIIILSAAVILNLVNGETIDSAKLASLASNYNNLQAGVDLYLSKLITSNVDLEFDKEKILLGVFDDSYRLVQKDEGNIVEAVINKNNEEIHVYKLDEQICKSNGIEIPKTPSKGCLWYISNKGQVYLVYNEDAIIPAWIIGNPPEGKQIENEVLDRFVAKIGEWEKEPSIYDTVPVADANMFTYTNLSDGTVSIKGFNPEYNGEIPTEIKFPTIDPNGKTITKIESYAFYQNSNFTTVVIPEGVKEIGSCAFGYCTELKKVYLPTTLASISNGSDTPFYRCSKIEEITVPNYMVSNIYGYEPNTIFSYSKTTIATVNFVGEITSIVSSAFNGFTALKSITIPSNVTSIGNYAFYECTSLSGKLTIPENVTKVGQNAFYNCSKITEVEFLSKGKLKTIDAYAFGNLSLITSITIPEGVKEIRSGAFRDCTELKKVYLPTTLASIANGSSSPFYRCSKIEEITVPNYMVSNIYGYEPNTIFSYSKTTIATVNFVGEITSIASSAFNGFTALKSITIPSSVTSIGDYAFYECTSLSGKLTIPENVTKVGQNAFYNCSKITEVEFLSKGKLKTIDAYAFGNLSLITSITIPEGVKEIRSGAFRDCTELKKVYLPTTIASISNGSSSPFYRCSKIEEITVPNYMVSNIYGYEPSGIFSYSKTTIATVNFVGEITSIASSAFNGFTALKSITIPSSVTSIGDYAFYECTSLSGKLTIPENVTKVGQNAFYNCSKITEVEFLSKGKLETIDAYAFGNLSLITSITIPEGVKEIRSGAFSLCPNLETIVYSGTATGSPWGAENATVVAK